MLVSFTESLWVHMKLDGWWFLCYFQDSVTDYLLPTEAYPLCRRHLQLPLKPNLIQKSRFQMLAYVKKYYFWLSSPLSLQELSHLFERASDVGASSCLNKLPQISKTKTVFFIFHILHLIIFNLLKHLVAYWNSNHYYAAS